MSHTTLTPEQLENIRHLQEVVNGELKAQFKVGMRHGFTTIAEFFDQQAGLTFTAEQVALLVRQARESSFNFPVVESPNLPKKP